MFIGTQSSIRIGANFVVKKELKAPESADVEDTDDIKGKCRN